MIISGKELALSLKQEMAANVATFTEKYGRVPHLVVILVGEDPGSVSYVTGKAKAGAILNKIGFILSLISTIFIAIYIMVIAIIACIFAETNFHF